MPLTKHTLGWYPFLSNSVLIASNLAKPPTGFVHCNLHASTVHHPDGSNHVVPIRVGAVSHKLCIDPGPTGLGTFQLLVVDYATASYDAESVTILVEGSGGVFRVVVVGGEERCSFVRLSHCAQKVEAKNKNDKLKCIPMPLKIMRPKT